MDRQVMTRRTACGAIAAVLAVPVSAAAVPPRAFDAVVRLRGGTHASLAAALAAAPPGDAPFRILLGRGRWEEKLTVSRRNVAIVGEDRRDSIITASVASGHEKAGGGAWGTYGSATLTVEASGFTLSNLTVENGFDYVTNMRSRAVANAQAVALALGNSADRTLIDGVDLIGHQDTFYLRAGRALVRGCLIAGSTDFIFGGAAGRFEGCEIRSRLRPDEALQGYVAAPSTPRDQSVGLVFDRCRLTPEEGVGDGSVWLGRPWRAGGNSALLGAAAFLDCWMGAHIRPDGWTWMGFRGPGGYTMRLEPGDARFYEYRSRGPGARRSPARRQLTARDVARFSRAAMFGDWRP